MKLSGRRIHIAGSADAQCDTTVLSYAHCIVSELTRTLSRAGAVFLVDFGREPRSEGGGPAIIFYWTVIEAVSRALMGRLTNAVTPQGPLLKSLVTVKTDAQIPDHRRALYSDLRNAGAVSMEFVPQGWTFGGIRRERQAQLGDILSAISGGAGVEHLPRVYARRGKPVIPLDLPLGSSSKDGTGAAGLFRAALTDTGAFFTVKKGQSGPELLERTRTRHGGTPAVEVVERTLALLEAVVPPSVFYVRLLNKLVPEFEPVEAFFRKVVDPVVKEFGFEPVEIGSGANDYPWMNQAIFDGLHHSQVVLVDLTGLRPNCLIELGYGLGNAQRVMVTAHQGTQIPFDTSCIETYMWERTLAPTFLQGELKTYWARNFNRPPLVTPRGLR
jgi:hypothetical protein